MSKVKYFVQLNGNFLRVCSITLVGFNSNYLSLSQQKNFLKLENEIVC